MPYTIWLKKNEEKRLLSGHGWVYANEAAKIEGKDKNGSLALVRAADGRFIGKGYINHASKILVRIFIRGGEEDSEELYERRIRARTAKGTSLQFTILIGIGYVGRREFSPDSMPAHETKEPNKITALTNLESLPNTPFRAPSKPP